MTLNPVSTFRGELQYVTNGGIYRFDESGSPTEFTSGPDSFTSIAFGPPGPFGTALYAYDFATGVISRIDAAGDMRPFVTGFEPY